MQNSKLLPPAPPYARATDPQVMAWQIEEQRQAINHLQETKMDILSASVLRLVGIAVSITLGLLSLASPAQVAGILQLLLK